MMDVGEKSAPGNPRSLTRLLFPRAKVLFPKLLRFAAQINCVLPDIGKTGETVTARQRAKLGTGVEDFPSLGALEPTGEQGVDKFEVGLDLGRLMTLSIRRGNLAMMTVERA